MNRRDFMTMASSAGLIAGINSFAKGADEKSIIAGLQINKITDEEIASLPGDIKTEIFAPLYEFILNIKAVNNHMHYDDESSSIDWYLNKLVGKNNVQGCGVLNGLTKLLGIPAKVTESNKSKIRQAYLDYCKTHSQSQYWADHANLTNTENIVFMTQPEMEANKTLASKRFKMCVHIDQYLFPLDNSKIADRNAQSRMRAGMNNAILNRELKAMGLTQLPKKFDDYLGFVKKAFLIQKAVPNIVGGKWALSYYRSFDFRPGGIDDAKKAYENADTSTQAYTKLQDYMAYYVLKLCADHDFPLQIHSGLGAGNSLVLSDSEPAKMDYILSLEELSKAKVCFLHGGYPFCSQLGPMQMSRPNIHIDFSWMTLLLTPDTLANYIKEWLQVASPWNIIFGVDATGLAQFYGTWCGRKAVAIALTRMVQQMRISQEDARGYAAGIMRNNAMKLYSATWKS